MQSSNILFSLFIFCFIALGSSSLNIYASEVSDLVKSYEKEVESEITKQGKSEEDKYYIYALFARELLGLKEYELAKKYYEKALAAGEKAAVLNMSEVHYNMLFIRYKEGADKQELKERLSLVKRTLPEQSNPQVKMTLKYWEKVINDEKKEVTDELVNSFYGAQYSQALVKELILKKEYKKALSLLPTNIKDVNLVYKIQYDVLNRIVFDKKKELLCEASLKRFPNSVSYTMKICRFLKNHNQKDSIQKIEQQMTREKVDAQYLLSALKDIDKDKQK